MTENKIRENINNPIELEKLYRKNANDFGIAFNKIYSEIEDNKLAEFWKIRLETETSKESVSKINRYDIIILIATCLIAGFLIKIPDIFNINLKDFFFYEKNAGIIVFLGLSLYTILENKIFKTNHILTVIALFVIPFVYINILPSINDSSSINLAYIHLPLLMWCVFGFIHINFDWKDKNKRIDFIKHNGDLAVLGAIIMIAGIALTGITLQLFLAIDIKIEQFYFDYIAIFGLVSAPVVTSFVLHKYSSVTNKIAPIIANIFSPIVLITLLIYLITIPIAGKDPYNDRDFLLIFNMMLIGVMGIIVFSISETSANKKRKFNEYTLFFLVIVTLLIDIVALSAILYRVGEFGFTPNRTAVLGSNILIFVNLLLILFDLYKVNFKGFKIKQVEMTISGYLPVYIIWTLIVVFLFPLIFGFN